MVKKIAALAGAGVLLASMAGPALGCFGWWCDWSDEIGISNSATVTNIVGTVANTGHNDMGGKFVWGGGIDTGNATAGSGVINQVNWNEVGCDCVDGDITIGNRASVLNLVDTRANTGHNHLGGMCVGGGLIDTGNAGATSLVDNFINTNIVGW